MLAWFQNYGKTHAFYLILILGGVIGIHSWLAEHDARLAADAAVKQNQQIVAALQDGIKSRDAALAQKVQVITRVVHDVQTPTQAVAAIPQLVTPTETVALQAKPASDDNKAIEVQAVPFVQLLGQYQAAQSSLTTCQSDLADTKAIVTTDSNTIAALKKKPSFWKRVIGTGKAVGIGVGVGIVIAKRFL